MLETILYDFILLFFYNIIIQKLCEFYQLIMIMSDFSFVISTVSIKFVKVWKIEDGTNGKLNCLVGYWGQNIYFSNQSLVLSKIYNFFFLIILELELKNHIWCNRSPSGFPLSFCVVWFLTPYNGWHLIMFPLNNVSVYFWNI